MGKNTGKVKEFCHWKKVKTLKIARARHFSSQGKVKKFGSLFSESWTSVQLLFSKIFAPIFGTPIASK